MAQINNKRNRKNKLVPRNEVEYEDDDYKDILRLQDSVQMVSSLMKQATSNKSKRSSNMQFAVDVMIEELNEDEDFDKSKDTVDKTAYKFSAKQVVINKDIMWNELDKIPISLTSYADKRLSVEVRNSWGRLEVQQIKYSLKETFLQTAIVKWMNWVSSDKIKSAQPRRGQPLSYKCYACNLAWWRLMPFREHIEKHPEDHLDVDIEADTYECSIIAFLSDDREKSFINIDGPCPKCLNGVTQHKIYKCNICLMVFTTCTKLYNHKLRCGMDTAFGVTCSICNHKFYENSYETHLSIHTVPSDEPINNSVYIHRDCGMKYTDLNLHPCSLKLRNVYCDYCPRKFHSQLLAKLHMEIADSDITCQVCNELLPRECMEVEHLAAHSKNFCIVYKCSLCPKPIVFPDDVSAKYHMLAWHDKIETRNRTYNDMVIVPKRIVALWQNIDKMDPSTLYSDDYQRETDQAVHSLTVLNDIIETGTTDNSLDDIITNKNEHNTGTSETTINISNIKTENTDFDINDSQMNLYETVVDTQVEFNESKREVDLTIVKAEKDYDFDIEVDGHVCTDDELEIKKEMDDCNELLSNIYHHSNTYNNCDDGNGKDITDISALLAGNVEIQPHIKIEVDDSDESDIIMLRPPECSLDDGSSYEEIQVQPDINMSNMSTPTKKNKVYYCKKCNFRGHHKEYKQHIMDYDCHINRKKCNASNKEDTDLLNNEAPLNSQQLLNFQKLNSQPEIFTCTKCDVKLNFLGYVKHFTEHGLPKDCCPKCNETFADTSILCSHIRYHINQSFQVMRFIAETREIIKTRTYQCIECKGKIGKESMFVHWESHLEFGTCESLGAKEDDEKEDGECESAVDSALPVDKLKKVIKHVQGYLRVKTRRYPEGPDVNLKRCVVCLRTFERYNDCKRHLIEHLRTDAYAHYGKYNAFVCQICGDFFVTVDKYKQHMRDHASLPVYKCELCDRVFSDSSNFTKHKKVHNLQMYVCDICGKKFQAKASIQNHMVLHTETKPVDCEICGRCFTLQSDYKRHYRIAHIRSYAKFSCPICRKKFVNCKTKWDHMWNIHKTRHTQADCNICGKSFRKITDVKRHVKENHPNVYGENVMIIVKRQSRPKAADLSGVKFKHVTPKPKEVVIVID